MQIKTNARDKSKPNKLIITIEFVLVCCSKNGVIAATVKKAEKFAKELKRPQLIASPILGVNPTRSSYPMKIIGELKKPMKLVAIEIRIFSLLLVAKAKKMKLMIVIVTERMAPRFRTVIEFLFRCIFIIIRQKKTLPGMPRPLNSIPKVESNLASTNPNGKINCALQVENTQIN